MKVGKLIVLSGVIALSACYSKIEMDKVLMAELVCLNRGGVETMYVNARFVGNHLARLECANGDEISSESFDAVIRESVLAVQAEEDNDETDEQ